MCVAQIRGGYNKWDRTNIFHQSSSIDTNLKKKKKKVKFDVQQVRSNKNLADLFTKALPTTTFKKSVH